MFKKKNKQHENVPHADLGHTFWLGGSAAKTHCVTFILSVTKYLTREDLQKKGYTSVYSWSQIPSWPAGKTQWQDCEETGSSTPVAREQGAMNTGAHLTFSLSSSPGPQPTERLILQMTLI